ncbi:MAG: hypothetical protein ACJ786_09385 [Catenulispora sp.]
MSAMMLNQQDAGPAYGRYGALPSTFDATALDEITLYGELLQVVAAHPTTGKRLDWAVIDRALGLTPDSGKPGSGMPGSGMQGSGMQSSSMQSSNMQGSNMQSSGKPASAARTTTRRPGGPGGPGGAGPSGESPQ